MIGRKYTASGLRNIYKTTSRNLFCHKVTKTNPRGLGMYLCILVTLWQFLLRCRDSFKIAWIKASQVWIIGFKTKEYSPD